MSSRALDGGAQLPWTFFALSNTTEISKSLLQIALRPEMLEPAADSLMPVVIFEGAP